MSLPWQPPKLTYLPDTKWAHQHIRWQMHDRWRCRGTQLAMAVGGPKSHWVPLIHSKQPMKITKINFVLAKNQKFASISFCVAFMHSSNCNWKHETFILIDIDHIAAIFAVDMSCVYGIYVNQSSSDQWLMAITPWMVKMKSFLLSRCDT